MKIRLHYSVYLIFFIALFTGLLNFVLTFSLVLIIHELGHILIAKLCKYEIKEIYISLIGGVIKLKENNYSPFKTLITSLSGIIFNLIFLLINNYTVANQLFFKLSMLFIIFNILPIFPLDGFRVLESMIRIKSLRIKGFKFLVYLSLMLVLGVIFYSIYIKSVGLLIIGLFLLKNNIILFNHQSLYKLQLMFNKNY